METEQRLKSETEKWAAKLRKELPSAAPAVKEGREFIVNIKAYLDDSGRFTEKGDLVRAFEAVVWAWAWLEIGREMKILKVLPDK
jgi:hypothetical protein